jgi:hypothetical protein
MGLFTVSIDNTNVPLRRNIYCPGRRAAARVVKGEAPQQILTLALEAIETRKQRR